MDKTRDIVRIPKTTPSVPKGKNYVLAIGIDDYTHHRPLKNAVADATAFVDVMTARYGFEHLNEPLFNKDATKRNIVKALGKCEALDDNDRLIVFYSGHGWYKTAAKLGYLVPTDAEDDPNFDFIEVTSILNIFKGVKANHILLVVDCCFGGSFGLERNVNVSVTEAMTEKKIAKLDNQKSRMVLSSGGIELVSDGLVFENNSPFTKPLVEILKENKASQMAFSEFFNQLQKKTLWNADQIPQYKPLPYLGHADGELALYCTDLESAEDRAYRKTMESQSISVLAKFIKDFPQSEHKTAVRTLLKEKRVEEAWAKIKNSRFIEDFDEFIETYPDSSFAALAQQKMDDLEIIEDETPLPKPTVPPQYIEPKIEKPTIIIPKKFDFEPEMVLVKGGTFTRASQKVTLSDFSIGKFPVTQKQWQTIMGNNPSNFKGENLPVESVNWDDCQEFIKKLNEKTGKIFRLPTEAEWEFAARGGNQSKGFEYSGSNSIDEVAWYRSNSDSKTQPVASKKANELGIYDMSGNVWEWCNDWYGDFSNSAVTNPQGAQSGSSRVLRGGSWFNDVNSCRSSYRSWLGPSIRNDDGGFRLARD